MIAGAREVIFAGVGWGVGLSVVVGVAAGVVSVDWLGVAMVGVEAVAAAVAAAVAVVAAVVLLSTRWTMARTPCARKCKSCYAEVDNS